MQRTADELAAYLGGRVEGLGTAVLHRVGRIESAVVGELTFLANPDYEGFIYSTGASAAIVGEEFRPTRPLPDGLTLIRVQDPYAAFGRILELAEPAPNRPLGVHPTAVIDPTATVGVGCSIGPHAVVEAGASVGDGVDLRAHAYIGYDAHVGPRTMLHVGVYVGDRCEVGADCILQPHAVIGADGFGFAPQADGAYRKVPQTGNVIVGDRCEIGAATTIDRATLRSTRIGTGAVVGPNSHLTDCEVGTGAVVHSTRADGARIGTGVEVGPFAHLRPGTVLGEGARVGAFVQTKNAAVGAGAKVPHLAYVGDADVGAGANVACGVVTVNYDGRTKHRTVVGEGAFVGCGTMLVAPVEVGAGANIAAGSTITDDVPPEALAIGRARQVVKEGRARGRLG
ncbi:MAG: UDP-3-O-(3-hydroxymyristoyl)glucosamine N-acyltransferase [Flavobacteriales bacterium]